MSFKPEMRDMAEEIFASRKNKPDFVEYEFKQYKGTYAFVYMHLPSLLLFFFI